MFLEVPQDRIGLIFTRKEIIAIVGSVPILGRVILCTKKKAILYTKEKVTSCTKKRVNTIPSFVYWLIIDANTLIYFLANAVPN